MDYAVLSTLMCDDEPLKSITLSYDICCQWNVNLASRISKYPDRLKFNLTDGRTVNFVVPSFHLLAHGYSCQLLYAFPFLRGLGRTCGEGIEQNWASSNPLSASTQEMTPQQRDDVLHDHWGGANQRKKIGLGVYLRLLFLTANQQSKRHSAVMEALNTAFAPEVIAQWEGIYAAYYNKTSNVNPFEDKVTGERMNITKDMAWNNTSNERTGLSLAQVRLRLQKDKAREKGAVANRSIVLSTDFLKTGLELEVESQELRVDVNEQKSISTANKAAGLQSRVNAYAARLDTWRTIQAAQMPGLFLSYPKKLHIRGSQDAPLGEETVDTTALKSKLLLPSGLEPAERTKHCSEGLVKREIRMRFAEAEDQLAELRRQMRIKKEIGDRHTEAPDWERSKTDDAGVRCDSNVLGKDQI